MVREVFLVGIGLGNPATMTLEARDAIRRSELIVGAARMVEPYADTGVRVEALIRTDDIVRALSRDDAQVASVLFSGDVGFYSGATALAEKLRDIDGMRVRAIPGISSLVYLCARLLTPWQDAHLVSAHGRQADPVEAVRAHRKTFFLTGGKTKAHDICAVLAASGLGEVCVSVGERLSYDDECVTTSTAAELSRKTFADLSVMLVVNREVDADEPGRLEEAGAAIRPDGATPGAESV